MESLPNKKQGIIRSFTKFPQNEYETMRKDLGLSMKTGELASCATLYRKMGRIDISTEEVYFLDAYLDSLRHRPDFYALDEFLTSDSERAMTYRDMMQKRALLEHTGVVTLQELLTIGTDYARALGKESPLPEIDGAPLVFDTPEDAIPYSCGPVSRLESDNPEENVFVLTDSILADMALASSRPKQILAVLTKDSQPFEPEKNEAAYRSFLSNLDVRRSVRGISQVPEKGFLSCIKSMIGIRGIRLDLAPLASLGLPDLSSLPRAFPHAVLIRCTKRGLSVLQKAGEPYGLSLTVLGSVTKKEVWQFIETGKETVSYKEKDLLSLSSPRRLTAALERNGESGNGAETGPAVRTFDLPPLWKGCGITFPPGSPITFEATLSSLNRAKEALERAGADLRKASVGVSVHGKRPSGRQVSSPLLELIFGFYRFVAENSMSGFYHRMKLGSGPESATFYILAPVIQPNTTKGEKNMKKPYFRTDVMKMKGSPLKGENPLPYFRRELPYTPVFTAKSFPEELKVHLGTQRRTLPYTILDKYERKTEDMSLETFVLENDNIRATFCPGVGGKLWSLFDKTRNLELLMANTVFRPCNLAIRNAWTSGGIEWNFGNYGHTAFTCESLFCARMEDEEGHPFVRVYEFERMKECVYQIDFHLPADSKVLFAHMKVWNPNDTDTTTYWWSNIAVPQTPNTRVLSSTQDAIIMGGKYGLLYEKLPYLSVASWDVSFPYRMKRSYDYFFQCPEDVKTAWEASAEGDGSLFFNFTTSPLLYHKMFCWGNQKSGFHWQEYLSEPNKGYYIELQSGFARSQLHDKLFKAHEVLEWTQCFGGADGSSDILMGEDYPLARKETQDTIYGVISEEKLLEMDKRFRELAKLPVEEKQLFHRGSGWGALENRRRKACGLPSLGSSVCFPESSLGEAQKPWLSLLENGILPAPAPEEKPLSFMISDSWRDLLAKSLTRPEGKNWFSLYHYGIMLYEAWDTQHIVPETNPWPLDKESADQAQKAWEESLACRPTVWTYRNLAKKAWIEGNLEKAIELYKGALDLGAAGIDYHFAVEFMKVLNQNKNYAESWSFYSALPEDLKKIDRVMLTAIEGALRTNQFDFVELALKKEYADIREGECVMTDWWFEYQARLIAQKDGIDCDSEKFKEILAEVKSTMVPPTEIDFRQSLDEADGYEAH